MLKKAYISEKSMDLAKGGLYTFLIPLSATKEMVAKVVEEKFKVDVVSVKTIKIQGKRRLQRSRKGYYWESAVKKALVQVKKGQKIALFEHINKEPFDSAQGKEDVKVTTAETTEAPKKEVKKPAKTEAKVEKKATPVKKTASKKATKKETK